MSRIMVKWVRGVGAVYILFCLVIVFFSQARCARSQRTLPKDMQHSISNIDVVPPTEQPKGWKRAQLSASQLRSNLDSRSTKIIDIPTKVPQALRSLELLKVRYKAAPVDPLFVQISQLSDTVHDSANKKIQGKAYRARGVPVYTRSYSSSSYHK